MTKTVQTEREIMNNFYFEFDDLRSGPKPPEMKIDREQILLPKKYRFRWYFAFENLFDWIDAKNKKS